MSDLLPRLRSHIACMAPHQKDRKAGKLLIEATEQLAELNAKLDTLLTDKSYEGGVQYWINKHDQMMLRTMPILVEHARLRQALVFIAEYGGHVHYSELGDTNCDGKWASEQAHAALNFPKDFP